MRFSENFSLKPVPHNERKGAVALTFVMLGLTFFSASMWTGGTLGTSLTYNDFWLAVILGNLMLGIYTSFSGISGLKTGLTTYFSALFLWYSRFMVALFITWWHSSWLVWCWRGDVCNPSE